LPFKFNLTHNLYPFKPITYKLSSGKTGFKVCLSKCDLWRYAADQLAKFNERLSDLSANVNKTRLIDGRV
jgi:hypothetical protein